MILKYSHHIFSRLNYNVYVCFVYPGPLMSPWGGGGGGGGGGERIFIYIKKIYV